MIRVAKGLQLSILEIWCGSARLPQ